MIGRSRSHHGSHRKLLTHFLPVADGVKGVSDPVPGAVDAVIVASSRGAKHLAEAERVATGLSSSLLVLCSKDTSVSDVEALVGENWPHVVAVDIEKVSREHREHETTRLLRQNGFDFGVDTSLKRNAGLAIAQRCGWTRVLLLDDDVTIPELSDVAQAARLLNTHGAVGLDNAGFRDNSVVCHAYREIGDTDNAQDQFISTMALLIDPSVPSFFPHIYNEDWLYLISDDVRCREQGLAVTGRVLQEEYDPFSTPGRAEREELGDTIAEGLYWLLDNGLRPEDADVTFWEKYLRIREEFITDVMIRFPASKDHDGRRAAALIAARSEHKRIDAALCAEFLRAWRADLRVWASESGERIGSARKATLNAAADELRVRAVKWHL